MERRAKKSVGYEDIAKQTKVNLKQGSALWRIHKAAISEGFLTPSELSAISGESRSNVSMFLDMCRYHYGLVMCRDGKFRAVPFIPDPAALKDLGIEQLVPYSGGMIQHAFTDYSEVKKRLTSE